MKRLCLIILAMFCMTISQPAQSEETSSGRALPRMVSFRSNYVNTRSGPGGRYPIEWIYKQKNAPVEIIAEYEAWKKIKDWEGSESWVHQQMLTNKRWVKITKKGTANIYAKPQATSRIIAKVEDQVIGQVEKCPEQKDFCLIKFSQMEGWVNRFDFFGVYPDEVIN